MTTDTPLSALPLASNPTGVNEYVYGVQGSPSASVKYSTAQLIGAGMVGLFANLGSIAATASVIQTSGYAAIGVGEGLYKAVDAGPATSYRKQSAAGTWYEYIESPQGADLQCFGAIPDGAVGAARALTGTDNASAIRDWLWFATRYKKCPAVAPAGNYLTSRPLDAGYGEGSHLDTAVIIGAAKKYRGESSFTGTAFLCNYNNAPGIAVSGGRKCRIYNITLIGTNFNYVESNGLGGLAPALADMNVSAWVDPTFPSASSSQYAPYCGVAIDPYAGVQPIVHYPDVQYPPELGVVAQYGKNVSSDVVLEDVEIVGFVSAVAIQPSNVHANGDFIKLIRVNGENCVYGVTVGSDQNRNFQATDCIFSHIHTIAVTGVNGVQNGKLQGAFDNCQISNCIQWFDIPNSSVACPLSFRECYGEVVYRVGKLLSGGSSAKQLVLDMCAISFTGQTEGATYARGRPTWTIEGSDPNLISIRGGSFSNYLGLFSCAGTAANYTVEENASFTPQTTPASPVTRLFRNFLAGVFFVPTASAPIPDRFVVAAARYSQSASLGTETLGSAIPLQRTHTVCAWSRTGRPVNAPDYPLSIPPRWFTKAKSSFSSVSLTNITLTLVFSSWADDLFVQRGPLPGDTIYDDNSGVVFRVRSRSTLTVIADMITGYAYDGSTYTLNAAFSTTAGNLNFGNGRIYLPSDPLIGDLDTSSSTIANVGTPTLNGTMLTTEVKPGDSIYVNALDPYIASNKSLLDITTPATNGSPGSLTLNSTNKPAITQTKHPLGFFVQVAPSNE